MCSEEATSGDVGETQRCHLLLQEDLCGQSVTGDEAEHKQIWGNKKGFLKNIFLGMLERARSLTQ